MKIARRHVGSGRTYCFGIVALLACAVVSPTAAGQDFQRGDANADGVLDLGDAVWSLSVLFIGGAISCQDALDSNDDGAMNIADPVYTLTYLFSVGPPPPLPWPSAGVDPTADALGCNPPPYPGLTFLAVNASGYEEYTLDVDPSVILILIPIDPSGTTFTMGQQGVINATPEHAVTLTRSYFISKHEITNAQYKLYCDLTGSPYPPIDSSGLQNLPPNHFTDPQYADHPVVLISWNELVAPGGYLDWAGLALPSEAQWEYAARPTGESYPWGNDAPNAGGTYRGNYCTGGGFPLSCGLDDGWQQTAPVGTFASFAGPFGTLDQAGNVYEWCLDAFAPYTAAPATDPVFLGAPGASKVVRGGAWFDPGGADGPTSFFSAYRIMFEPDPILPYPFAGFRPVLEIP